MLASTVSLYTLASLHEWGGRAKTPMHPGDTHMMSNITPQATPIAAAKIESASEWPSPTDLATTTEKTISTRFFPKSVPALVLLLWRASTLSAQLTLSTPTQICARS